MYLRVKEEKKNMNFSWKLMSQKGQKNEVLRKPIKSQLHKNNSNIQKERWGDIKPTNLNEEWIGSNDLKLGWSEIKENHALQ